MIEFELEQLRNHPDWQLVLAAYHSEQIAAGQSEQFDGWVQRLPGVEGVKPEHLPRIHGKLIAFGFLQFELAERTAGVRYQLTRIGVMALDRLSGSAAGDDSETWAQSA